MMVKGDGNQPSIEAAAPMTLQTGVRRPLSILGAVGLGLLVAAILTEGVSRLAYFVADGRNPYYLVYGFAPNLEWNSNEQDGYNKFFPNSTRHVEVRGHIVGMRINSDGFRSPFDFRTPKPPSVFRVACLGGSSTFGYEALDDETYPHYLQQLLRESHPGQRVEVLNLGIPQLRMSQILALARAELPRLLPDVIIFYEGYNNAMMPQPRHRASATYRLKDWFYFHSVAWRVVHSRVRGLYHQVSSLLNRDVVGTHGLDLPITFPADRIGRLRADIQNEFTQDLAALADFSHQVLGVPLILVTQTMTWQRRGDPVWVSYDREVNELRKKLALSGVLTAHETVLLAHSDIQTSVRALARARELTLVDGIALLDEERRANMASMVHLTPEGNRRLARGVAAAIDVLGPVGFTSDR